MLYSGIRGDLRCDDRPTPVLHDHALLTIVYISKCKFATCHSGSNQKSLNLQYSNYSYTQRTQQPTFHRNYESEAPKSKPGDANRSNLIVRFTASVGATTSREDPRRGDRTQGKIENNRELGPAHAAHPENHRRKRGLSATTSVRCTPGFASR